MHPPLTLVILAAGMGSRFGGPKQLAAVGPSGETLIEYGLYDARRAGFERFVFVIRREIEQDFRNAVLVRFEHGLDCSIVFQETDDFPELPSAEVLEKRAKPWGTGHALWSARDVVRGACEVMNADDFYGAESFAILASMLRDSPTAATLVSFRLDQTLSSLGGVSRGICDVSDHGLLNGVIECKELALEENRVRGLVNDTAATVDLSPSTPVSMNLMGFPEEIWIEMEQALQQFAGDQLPGSTQEFGLPDVLNKWMSNHVVRVLASPERWIGVTHAEDLAVARSEIHRSLEQGKYPTALWAE